MAIRGNLVSEDDKDTGSSNQGVTIPGGNDAIYSIMLSPFFMGRFGRYANEDAVVSSRGIQGFYWSNTTRNGTYEYRIGYNGAILNPSNYSQLDLLFSLRCLVSTTNS